MNKDVEINICEEKLNNTSKRKRRPLRKHQKKFANRIQYDLSDTAVKIHDASHSLLNAAATSTSYEEFPNEDQENTDLRHNTNVFEKGNNFEEDVEMLLDACRTEHSQIRTKAFYCGKIRALYKNHIQKLMKENATDCGQSLKKRNRNKGLIDRRLNAIRKVLRKFKENNRFSGLEMDKFLRKQNNQIYCIKSKLNESEFCNVKKPAKTKTVQKSLRQNKNELKALRNELRDKVNTIQQQSHNAEEINKLKVELNMYKTELTRTLDNRKAACKELIDELNNEHGTLTEHQLQNFCKENSASSIEESINIRQTKIELKAVRKELKNKVNVIQWQSQNAVGRNLEINKLKVELNMYRTQLTQILDNRETACKELIGEMNNEHVTLTEHQLQDFCKENSVSSIEEFINMQDKNKVEISQLQIQLAVTQQELESVKQSLKSKTHTIEQYHECQSKYKTQQFNDLIKDNEVLQNRLAQTRKELRAVKKKLDNEAQIVQQKSLQEEKDIKLCNVKEAGMLESQLTETQHELKIIKRDLSNKVIIIQQKAQHEREVKKKLNKAEEDVKLLQRQLAETQQELGLESLRPEFNNGVRQEQFSHKFSRIRLMLVEKLCFDDQNGRLQWLENYMKEESCQGIESDILRLIEDQVPSLDKSFPETVIGSNILKVTENELHLLILIASILKVLQFSASLDAIYSFVAEVDDVISRQDVESLLKKFPTLFKEESVGAGASNKNWRYLYLKPIITI